MAKKNLKSSKDKYPKGKGKTKAYPSVKSKDFAGKNRKYPIPTKADAVDALKLAGLHGRYDIKSKVYKRYPSLKNNKKYTYGGTIPKYAYGTDNTVPLSALQVETPQMQGFNSQQYFDSYDIAGSVEGSLNNQNIQGAVPTNQNYSGAISQTGNYLGNTVENMDSADGNPSIVGSVASGALTGAAAGATIGSAIPVIGTAVGGVVGGVVGGISGYVSGTSAESEAEQMKQAQREQEIQRKRALKEQTPEMYYKPTITYPDGGTVKYDPKKIIDQYGTVYNALYNDTTLIPGDIKRYDDTKYLGPTDEASNGYTGITFVQDSTMGVPTTWYRTFKDKCDTTKTFECPLISSDTFDKYMKYPNGGVSSYENNNLPMGRPNAELETDEVYRKPNGEIEEVPENTPSHKDGGIKLSLPEGTEILGKMKGKYNGKSYKELGQTLQKKYEKYNSIIESSDKTRIAKATAKKMLDKVQAQFDELLQQQEVQKMINGSQSTNTYAKGGTVPKYPNGKGDDVLKWMRFTKPDPALAADFVEFAANNPGYFGKNTISTDLDSVMSYWNQIYSGKNNWVGDTNDPSQWATGPALYKYATDPNAPKSISGYQGPSYEDDINYEDLYKSEVSSLDRYLEGAETPGDGDINIKDERNGFNWGNTGNYIGTAAQFAPAAYNMYQGLFGKPDELNYSDYRNPYTGRIMRNLEDRRYNVRPELEANELAYQTARRNVRQVAPGVGNLLTNYNALSGNRMRADAQALARKQNMENQWRGQDAQILANMGAQEAATKLNVDDYNAQARAAKQQALSTGLDQLAGSAANIMSERNMKSRDAGLYSVLDSYLSAFDLGDLTNDQYQDIIRILQRGKKTKQGE